MKQKSVLANEQRLKADRRVSVTVKHLQDAMSQHCRPVSGHKEDKEDEITLCSGGNDRHKDNKKLRNEKRSKANCRDCGKHGHMAKDC